MEPNLTARNTLGLAYGTVCIAAVIAFNIWFLVFGEIADPVQQLYTFWKTGEISDQKLSWTAWKLIAGFALLMLWTSMSVAAVSFLIVRRMPRMTSGYERIFNLSPYWFGTRVLGNVFVEELLYRWLPLSILFPLLDTDAMLKVIIVISSVAFAARHIINVTFEKRTIPFLLAQFVLGIILSYVFLALEFSGALTVHLIFDLPLLVLVYGVRNMSPDLPSFLSRIRRTFQD